MRKIYVYLLVCCLAIFSSCEKDGDKIIVSGLDSSEMVNSESDLELSIETKDAIMLSLSWDESELSISDSTFAIPDNVPSMTLNVSASESFSSYKTYDPESNLYYFTGSQLNTLAKDFGFTVGESTPMYFRIVSTYGENSTRYYSNTVTVNVISYLIDMTKGFILDENQADTGFYLYCPDEDGEYYGFTGIDAGWYHWYLKEGDGTIWGNYHEGEVGTEFLLSSESANRWNFWYPGNGGCYYTTLSTNDMEWTATYIPDLQITGDVTGEMTFDYTTVTWSATVTTTTDNANVKVSCSDAALYNMETGTADDGAVAKEIGFIADASGSLSFEESADAATNITIATAGTYTLSLSLSDPMNWHYEVTVSDGTEPVEPEPETVYDQLYLTGIDDGRTGTGWNFDNTISLLNADNLTYAGVADVNSLWGYKIGVEVDNWSDYYGMGDSEGTLMYQNNVNIPAPGTGLYLIQADLKNLTYSHTAIGSQIYIGGLNDVWDFTSVVLNESSENPGLYTGTAEITGTSSWGIKIYLFVDDWVTYFGGSYDQLTYQGANITEPMNLSNGTYTVTVDLIGGNCSFTLQ